MSRRIIPRAPITEKQCRTCRIVKSPGEFFRNSHMSDGYMKDCKTCWRAKHGDAIRSRQHAPDYLAAQADYNRRRNAEHPDKIKASARRWHERNAEKRRAHGRVRVAKEYGRLVRQPCEVCGAANTHAHHDDYSKPLEVNWLCPLHHGERHYELNRAKKAGETPRPIRVAIEGVLP